MPPGVPDPSLEPLLRARASGAYPAPSSNFRTRRSVNRSSRLEERTNKDDFVDFLHSLARLAASPITIPLNLIHKAITSPLTLSLAIKLILLGLLVLASAAFSVLAVGAFWWSWGTGGNIEVEGWLTYGSRSIPTPHSLIPLVASRFQEDLRYDVYVELELVRPSKMMEEHGNFMLGLELGSAKNVDISLYTAAQPSLPPSPLLTSYLPSSPIHIPCIFPWPLTPLCPSHLLGYAEDTTPQSVLRRRRKAAGSGFSTVSSRDVVLLKKHLMEGVVPRPGRGEMSVGSAFVSIGREDAFDPSSPGSNNREVRTTGWVVVRFIPRPTGIRWLMSFHPIPPLLLLPPIALALTLSSSFLAFIVITYLARPKAKPKKAKRAEKEVPRSGTGSIEEQLLEERRAREFERRDQEEREEGVRRQREWEEVESLARGGLRKIPENRKRGSGTGSTVLGGSETTAPTILSSAQTASTSTALTSNSSNLRRRAPVDESDDTDQEVRTESTYAPLEMGDRAREGEHPREGTSEREEGSESSEDWDEVR